MTIDFFLFYKKKEKRDWWLVGRGQEERGASGQGHARSKNADADIRKTRYGICRRNTRSHGSPYREWKETSRKRAVSEEPDDASNKPTSDDGDKQLPKANHAHCEQHVPKPQHALPTTVVIFIFRN